MRYDLVLSAMNNAITNASGEGKHGIELQAAAFVAAWDALTALGANTPEPPVVADPVVFAPEPTIEPDEPKGEDE